MSRIKEITVSLDLTVQPKAYQSVRLGLSVTQEADDGEDLDGAGKRTIVELRQWVSEQLRQGLQEEVALVYGQAVADYCVNQKG